MLTVLKKMIDRFNTLVALTDFTVTHWTLFTDLNEHYAASFGNLGMYCVYSTNVITWLLDLSYKNIFLLRWVYYRFILWEPIFRFWRNRYIGILYHVPCELYVHYASA